MIYINLLDRYFRSLGKVNERNVSMRFFKGYNLFKHVSTLKCVHLTVEAFLRIEVRLCISSEVVSLKISIVLKLRFYKRSLQLFFHKC